MEIRKRVANIVNGYEERQANLKNQIKFEK